MGSGEGLRGVSPCCPQLLAVMEGLDVAFWAPCATLKAGMSPWMQGTGRVWQRCGDTRGQRW